jgi:hypothetical protein
MHTPLMAEIFLMRRKCSIKVCGVTNFWMHAVQEVSLYPLVRGQKVCLLSLSRFITISIRPFCDTGMDSEESQRLAFGGILMRQNLKVRLMFLQSFRSNLIGRIIECASQYPNSDEEERRAAGCFGSMGLKLQRR